MIETARVKIRKIGNSQGAILPKIWLDLMGADVGDEIILSVEEVVKQEKPVDESLFDE